RAGELLDRAVRLGPSYVWGVHWRSMLHFSRGRYAAAVVDARKARELDPLSPVVAYANASILLGMDSVDAALPFLEQAARSSTPASFWLRTYGEQLARRGRVAETQDVWAQWARGLGYPDAERVRALWAEYPLWGRPLSPLDAWDEDETVRAWGREWRALLEDVLAGTGAHVPDLSYAWAWAGPDALLDAAEVIVEDHSIWSVFLNQGALYRPLADEPRYQALLRRVGLPPPEGL
ncbi:MAG TPA: hypothetical protein VLL48_07805, partial [Longimicrobiales bacterium]|nr:hypothetical protein [Longimicrobiales bacterium]